MLLEVVTFLLDCIWNPTFFIGLIVFCAIRWWQQPHPRFPPGFRGLPFVGVVPFIGLEQHKKVNEWSKKYGPIFSLRFLSNNVVCLMNYEVIKEVSKML